MRSQRRRLSSAGGAALPDGGWRGANRPRHPFLWSDLAPSPVLPAQPTGILTAAPRLQRHATIWINSHLTAPPPGRGLGAAAQSDAAARSSGAGGPGAGSPGGRLGFVLDALPTFASAEELVRCGRQIMDILAGYGIACESYEESGESSPTAARQPPLGAPIVWLRAGCAIAAGHGFTLGFAPDALPAFGSADALRACAQELIALLRRYGIACELREAD